MARFRFNQIVKHDKHTYNKDDIVTLDDDLAIYFASNSWGDNLDEGGDVVGEPIINPGIEPSPSQDIVLEVHNSVIGTEDSNG